MNTDAPGKVRSHHLGRNAYLYVRQSSLRQVLEHTESTERQYALKQRAIALGWHREQVVVVDSDLGRSAASASDREGFQQLVTEVSLGRAGIVMGLEVSRLARNSTDWHRLLEICALADTLILDEDGIYDPAHFNDRLLLGLKGTMSEAELHLLRARLIGGMMNKARRGELRMRLPVGFAYDGADRVILDPDQQVQQALRVFFETFHRVGSATATVKEFRRLKLCFPRRVQHGARKGEILWGELEHHRARWVLHHPRYAGVFCYGRSRQRKHGDARYRRLPREEWIAFIPNAHPGYISWEEYEANVARLRENSAARGEERRKSPPREGPALLQGLAICGKCGKRMTVRYHRYKNNTLPDYVCQKEAIERAEPPCQRLPGAEIDRAVGALAVETLTPMTLELTFAVQQELETQFERADQLRYKAVERAQYEAELAKRRYLRVDPDNRLVADSLEADWNEKLRGLEHARQCYEQQRKREQLVLDENKREKLLALSTDFPKLWHDIDTPQRERKRMLRLLIEDVTLQRTDQILVHVRFRGGATKTLELGRPLPAWALRQTGTQVVAAVDGLIAHHTDKEIAEILNERGMRSGEGRALHRLIVRRIRLAYGLKSRYERLREAGYLTGAEIATELGVAVDTVKAWRYKGWLRAMAYDDKPHYLYAPLGADPPKKYRWKSGRYGESTPHVAKGAQYEA